MRNEPPLAHPGAALEFGNMDENYLPVVAGVAIVGDRVLRLLFSDGTAGDVDFSSERWTGVLEPLNNSAYFAQAAVHPEAGTIVWPGGIDLAPEPLYEQAQAAIVPVDATAEIEAAEEAADIAGAETAMAETGEDIPAPAIWTELGIAADE